MTACVPGSNRVDDLTETTTRLVDGSVAPGTVLVSLYDADAPRQRVSEFLEALTRARDLDARLLAPPPCGNRSGNRNWLASHVQTPYLLFLDDDVDVDPGFLENALARMHAGCDVVVAAASGAGGSGWLTGRGHFKPAAVDDPVAVGLACSLWNADLFRSLWLDERIGYGYEDADLSLRLYSSGQPRVEQSNDSFVHRGANRTAGVEPSDRLAAIESSRCYVTIKRYAGSRRRLARFLAVEGASTLARRRRFPPRATAPQQWKAVTAFLLGGARPAWANLERPLVTHLERRT